MHVCCWDIRTFAVVVNIETFYKSLEKAEIGRYLGSYGLRLESGGSEA